MKQEGREAHKDTDVTLRFKMQLVVQGGVAFPTKLEISFRPGRTDDVVLEEPAGRGIVARYLDPAEGPLVVPHYARMAAVRQKLAALALRSQVQARDVFDLFALTNGTMYDLDLQVPRQNLDDATLLEARTRHSLRCLQRHSARILRGG